MIWQIDFPSCWSAALQQDYKDWAGPGLILRSALAGAFILMALLGSNLLLKEHIGLCLVLALLSALAVVDQALKTFPVKKFELAPGLLLTMLSVFMLFHH